MTKKNWRDLFIGTSMIGLSICLWFADEYTLDLGKAVSRALERIEGTYGIAVMHRDDPKTIVAARRGSPLCIGIGNEETETYIASDTYALPPEISRVIYLEDGHVATITADTIHIHKADQAVEFSHKITGIEHKYNAGDKEGYSTFLEKEIREQPVAIRNAMRGKFSKDFTNIINKR